MNQKNSRFPDRKQKAERRTYMKFRTIKNLVLAGGLIGLGALLGYKAKENDWDKKAKEDLDDFKEGLSSKAEEASAKLTDAMEEASDKTAKLKNDALDAREAARAKAAQIKGDLREGAENLKDDAEDFKKDAREDLQSAKETGSEVKENVHQLAEDARDEAEDWRDYAEEKLKDEAHIIRDDEDEDKK